MRIKLQIILLILILPMEPIKSKKTKRVKVRFLTVSVIPNSSHLDSCEAGITPGSKGLMFDFKGHITTNIIKDFSVELQFFTKSKKEADYNKFFTYDFELCKLMEGFMSQTVARLWAQSLKKFSNFPIKCPIMAGDYYIKRMKVDRKSIPMVAMNGFYMVKVQMYIKKEPARDVFVNATLEAEVTL
ncbi:uncharacterized protein LOC129919379 [Episyrphus balteatus]|uniref:uncharacterized protein LOC129919379 n=1 Tax=Episyrphus balteatus TaxID=286459 RepID=UPI002485085C|nr:uncharacterized protein LOC129919379 [Episyrphus balteatus]